MNIIKSKEILKDALNLYLDVITPYDFENIDDYNKKTAEVKEVLNEVEEQIEYYKKLKLSTKKQIELYGLPF